MPLKEIDSNASEGKPVLQVFSNIHSVAGIYHRMTSAPIAQY